MRRRFTRERTNDQAHTLAWRDGRPRLVICRMSAFCLPSQMPVWRPERQVSLAPSHRRSAMAEELFERSPPASAALDCAHCCQEAKLMSIRWIPLLSARVFAASTIGSSAGPCSQQIDRMQARIDAKLEAQAAAGPAATESSAALGHRRRARSRPPKAGLEISPRRPSRPAGDDARRQRRPRG